MFELKTKATAYSFMKKAALGLAGSYIVVATVLLMRMRPEPILIGVDQYGTRVIRDSSDRLLKKERENFLKRFLTLLYNYDSASFEERISESGDLMSDALWSEKRDEFSKIGSQLKTEDLEQKATVSEPRELDESSYQADVELKVRRKLTESMVKLRVDLRLRQNQRNENNPYPFEVERYDEQQAL